ncbi:MAG: hypothetical protein IKO42_03510 [Opitutales bacterium]|nr:hypothetical protein [Opitutales bacterium]
MKAKILLGIIAMFAAVCANADIRFKNIYQNNMVLQANEENWVAGKTDAKGQVEVRIVAKSKDGKTLEKTLPPAKVDKNGRWAVKIPKFPKRTNLEITAKNSGGETASISNVITGELWLGSGQSNMEWNFNAHTIEPEYRQKYREVADTVKGDVRTFVVQRQVFTEEASEVAGQWRIIEGRNLDQSGSQLAFIFACQLSKALDTPVGVIDSSWSGSRIEPWIPKSAFRAANPNFHAEGMAFDWNSYEEMLKNFESMRANYIKNYRTWFEENPTWELQNKNKDTKPAMPLDEISRDQLPAKMYNGKICGIAPLAPKGVLWYQGESNAGEPYEYGELFRLMVSSWRKLFKKDFYFYYVDLAAHQNTQRDPVQYGSLGGIREAMAEILALPKTGVATSLDSGGSKSMGQGDIHPPHKEMIATRLANLALAEVYKKGDPTAARSPYYAGEFKVDGSKLILKIANADGLRKMAGKEKLTGFAIRGQNPRDWKWANAEIKGDTIILSSAEVAEPKAARYAWGSWPLVSVESKHGLPLRSFSTDNGAYVDYGKPLPLKK